jgi:hypothetical protein
MVQGINIFYNQVLPLYHGPKECGNKQALRTKLGRFLWLIRLKWVEVQRHEAEASILFEIIIFLAKIP